jgi:sulfur carrier protein ThiS
MPGGKEIDRGIESIRIEDLLILLGINPVEVVIAKNGVLVTENEWTSNEDEIRVYRISHGG